MAGYTAAGDNRGIIVLLGNLEEAFPLFTPRPLIFTG